MFIGAYKSWEDLERRVLEDLLRGQASAEQLVEAIVSHHSEYKIFRRSLRQVSLDNSEVRQARAASRKRQVEAIHHWRQKRRPPMTEAAIATALLHMEPLAGALADDRAARHGGGPASAERL